MGLNSNGAGCFALIPGVLPGWFGTGGAFVPPPRKQSGKDTREHMNMKRMRGRNHRPNGGGGNGGGGFSRNQQNGIPLNRNHVFDSSGPEMRVRGTAQQLHEKYQQLARDAQSNGDRVLGEAYYQHAEHYFRIVSAINQAQGQPNPAQPNGANPPERGEYQRRDYPTAEHNEPMEPRQQEPRQQEFRQQEPRPERRFEPRQKPEYQRPERQEPRYRPEPTVDTRIDISSALEAELAAAASESAERAPAPEARAIPIIPDAPPTQDAAEPRPARPRGRPRTVKPKAETSGE